MPKFKEIRINAGIRHEALLGELLAAAARKNEEEQKEKEAKVNG